MSDPAKGIEHPVLAALLITRKNHMSASIPLTGRLTADPELRFTPSGKGVASFTIATNERRKNPDTGQWEDGDTSFFTCQAWNPLGENIVEHLGKGDAVVALGRIKQRKYQTKEGENRTVFEVNVDSIGPDLRWAKPKG